MYRDLVFDAAERLFASAQFDQVSMRDIAGEAGISPKTLYTVFAGKEEIYAEIVRRRSLDLIETIQAASGEGTALEKIAASVRAYVGYLLEQPSFFRILVRESGAWGLMPSADGQHEWRSGHRIQTELVRQGIAEGVFHEGDPDLMAAIAISIMQVYLAAMLERGGEMDVENVTAELVTQVQRSLRKLPPQWTQSSPSDS